MDAPACRNDLMSRFLCDVVNRCRAEPVSSPKRQNMAPACRAVSPTSSLASDWHSATAWPPSPQLHSRSPAQLPSGMPESLAPCSSPSHAAVVAAVRSWARRRCRSVLLLWRAESQLMRCERALLRTLLRAWAAAREKRITLQLRVRGAMSPLRMS